MFRGSQGWAREACAVSSNASWVMVTWSLTPPTPRQTDMTESITFPQLRWRAVMNTSNIIKRILNCLQFRTEPIFLNF